MAVASSRAGAWLYGRIAHPVDRAVMRLSGGRTTLSSLFAGVQPIWLTTTGARSGLPRTAPVLGIPDGERIILVASNWGQKRHPAWYHNLRAHPEVTVSINGRAARYMAHEVADQDEREACWQKAIAYYPGYAAYRSRVQQREIPVVRLTPQ